MKSSWFFIIGLLILLFAATMACDDDDDDAAADDDAADDDTADDDQIDDDAIDDDLADDDLAPRSFMLAAAPYQYDMGADYIRNQFDMDGFDGLVDIISLHMDGFFGLPWDSFIEGEDPPATWVAIMEDIRDQTTQLGVEVYLSLTPLDGMRQALTQLCYEEGGELIIEDEGRNPCFNFNNSPGAQAVREAYLAYVRWMVDFFQPTYLTNVIEMNIYDWNCPDSYDSLINLANEAYEQEKALDPELVIFPSFTMAHYWGFGDDGDCEYGDYTCFEQAVSRDASVKRDRFGISSYPVWEINNWGALPDDYYSAITDYTGDAVVFAEIGIGSYDITIPFPTLEDPCYTFVSWSTENKIPFMEQLFAKADQMSVDLLVWWSLRDFLPDHVMLNCPCSSPGLWCLLYEAIYDIGLLPAWVMWGSMGVLDYDGLAKPELATWQEWKARPID